MANSNIASKMTHERRTLAYYDRLPRSVRHAVANARFDWALNGWLKMFERGQMSAAELVKHIEKVDKIETCKTRFRAWGGEYPIFAGEITHIKIEKKRRKA